mmetsp:Transcript_6092/g.16521  ORF Transcript_6092/g.16521 Transcript_6092/m.16521 type:complete len:219 (+) Transcript_6092:361-1017(+)
MLGCEASFVVLLVLSARLYELIGEDHGPHLELARVERTVERKHVEHVVSEPAHTPLLDGDEHLVLVGQLAQELHIQGLHEARIRHRHSQAVAKVGVRLESTRRLHGGREAGAKGEDGHLVRLVLRSVLDHTPAPDGQHVPFCRHLIQLVAKEIPHRFQPQGRATREAHRRRQVVDGVGRGNHVHELELVRGRHDDEVGKAAEVGEVKAAVVCGTVIPH